MLSYSQACIKSKNISLIPLAFHLQGTSVLIRKSPGDDGMYKVSRTERLASNGGHCCAVLQKEREVTQHMHHDAAHNRDG